MEEAEAASTSRRATTFCGRKSCRSFPAKELSLAQKFPAGKPGRAPGKGEIPGMHYFRFVCILDY
jgi:hypothetical protein